MAITVSDIEQKEFAYKGAGYDPYDVDQYLDQICDEMVAQQDRIAKLEADLAEARRQAEVAVHAAKPVPVEPAKPKEEPAMGHTTEALEKILLNAQKLADGAVEDAKHKAEVIVKEAQSKADSILKSAAEEKTTLEKSNEDLRTAVAEFRRSFLKMMDEQKKLMDDNADLFEEKK
jgi:cell division initiation protein